MQNLNYMTRFFEKSEHDTVSLCVLLPQGEPIAEMVQYRVYQGVVEVIKSPRNLPV
jgi:hypothetical protein